MPDKIDIEETAAILRRMLKALLLSVPGAAAGEKASNLRHLAGDLSDAAEAHLVDGDAANILLMCFRSAEASGASWENIDKVRLSVSLEAPQSLFAIAMVNLGVRFCLSSMSRLLTAIKLVSREDIDRYMRRLGDAFAIAEETASDNMDYAAYRALVTLHATVIRDLTERGRPLPQIVSYNFSIVMPSLVMAQRIYWDGGRADELRNENKIVHPAFMPLSGRALSS